MVAHHHCPQWLVSLNSANKGGSEKAEKLFLDHFTPDEDRNRRRLEPSSLPSLIEICQPKGKMNVEC